MDFHQLLVNAALQAPSPQRGSSLAAACYKMPPGNLKRRRKLSEMRQAMSTMNSETAERMTRSSALPGLSFPLAPAAPFALLGTAHQGFPSIDPDSASHSSAFPGFPP
jgi:hypothetical protein